VQNTDPGFRTFSASNFDLIYSSVTLQHIPPRHAMRYLRGLIGLLRPGGLLIFQLPSEKRAKLADRVRSFLYEEIYKRYILRAEPSMDMYGVRKQQVIDFMERCGCRVLGVEPNYMAGPEWSSYRYAVVRLGSC
jgi:trans-aconitate methyltransferase